MKASSLIAQAAAIILDKTSKRWTLTEMLDSLNSAMREVAIQKPSAYTHNKVLPLQAGTFQVVPCEYTGIERIVRNLTQAEPRVGGRAVRITSRDQLDTARPDWHSDREKPEVREYVYDEADPHSFYVYPPNDGTGMLEAIMPAVPPLIVLEEGANPALLASYDLDIPLHDLYSNVLLDLVLYRTYMKDAQYAGNTQRSVLHYQAALAALGVRSQLDITRSPNTAAATKAS